MLGDDNGIVDPDAEEITDKAHSLAEKNVWARISIIAAGPIFNFLLAFVLAVIVIGFWPEATSHMCRELLISILHRRQVLRKGRF